MTSHTNTGFTYGTLNFYKDVSVQVPCDHLWWWPLSTWMIQQVPLENKVQTERTVQPHTDRTRAIRTCQSVPEAIPALLLWHTYNSWDLPDISLRIGFQMLSAKFTTAFLQPLQTSTNWGIYSYLEIYTKVVQQTDHVVHWDTSSAAQMGHHSPMFLLKLFFSRKLLLTQLSRLYDQIWQCKQIK